MTESSPIARFADAIEPVRSEMAGVTLKAFETDRRKRWLVERGIEIISETSRRLPTGTKPGVRKSRRRRSRASPTCFDTITKMAQLLCSWHVVRDNVPPLDTVRRDELARERNG
jgi:hypothetical protein